MNGRLLMVAALLGASWDAASAEYVLLRTSASWDVPATNGFYGTAVDLANGPVGVASSVSNINAAAEGAFGLARVHARVQADVSTPPTGTAVAYAEWEDQMTIVPDDIALLGQGGWVEAAIDLSGAVAVSAGATGFTATASYLYDLNLAGSHLGPLYGTWSHTGQFAGFPLLGSTNYGFSMTFGAPFTVRCYVEVTAGATGNGAQGGSALADINFARNANSMAIETLYGPGGPVTAYTVQSSSGASWRAPYLSPAVELTVESSAPGAIAVGVDHLVIGFTNVLEAAADPGATNWTTVADCSWLSGSTTLVFQADGANAIMLFRVSRQ